MVYPNQLEYIPKKQTIFRLSNTLLRPPLYVLGLTFAVSVAVAYVQIRTGRREMKRQAEETGISLALIGGIKKKQTDRGTVYYDGKDLENIEPSSLRRKIGTVMQQGAVLGRYLFQYCDICTGAHRSAIVTGSSY